MVADRNGRSSLTTLLIAGPLCSCSTRETSSAANTTVRCASIASLVKHLRPLRTSTIVINGALQDFPPQIPPAELEILTHFGFESEAKPNVLTRVYVRTYPSVSSDHSHT